MRVRRVQRPGPSSPAAAHLLGALGAQGSFTDVGARRGPRVSLQCSLSPTDVCQGPVAARSSSPSSPAELQHAPRPLLLRRAGGPPGVRFQLCHPAPGQALPIRVDCPAGYRGGPFIRIARQALLEPCDYASNILAGSATPPSINNIFKDLIIFSAGLT
ncbi:hypothetical protein NDU88_010790 [Pleurodeles waltl]|uniref:Uncharacterized protein n=1 Tax=Pleurodeles waltl TaxID=8319 RepID=A0AAV7PWK5_PLEWA|nr:hypothetical protein NDU88_010790 [Pleurodeles waltl]